ncbi:Fe-S cluster assembly protein SufD [Chelatococcus reniformis]|uniref:Fe-S cluster assembly protein SufD n=1 Tax=Chelatococcus reniformis TaxID=1494448 RepID=A0A916U1A3_9HYPH|nr:Fe-S cluster assembly protein SufD [Chelatococcus reniformis]GGC56787.1 Fe-S cluster assembly protein SufD [Chelatococcus reniformis]
MTAELSIIRTAAETELIERFSHVRPVLPGDGVVKRLRDEAFALFTASGLPHRRIEEWKYTDLRAFMRDAPPLALKPEGEAAARLLGQAPPLGDLATPQLTFANGHLVAAPSDLAGIEIVPLADALASGHPLTARMAGLEIARGNTALALNTAFMADGAIVHVRREAGAARLELRFVNGAAQSFATSPRLFIVVDDGAELDLVETHQGPDGLAYQVNSAVEIVAGAAARVSHVRVNDEGLGALAVSTLTVALGAGTDFKSFALTKGASVARHQIFLGCAGENATIALGGATMLRGRQHADTTLLLDHAVPHCTSRELFKTVVDDEAVGVFQGKIIVRPHAQKSDGRMMSAALLLSEGGTMNNKPELEIFADDVQCAHGATCGALDDDLLFYLMARGLPRPEAEALMVEAFLGEPLEFVVRDDVRDALAGLAATWLSERR